MNEHEFKRRFPRASASVIKLNSGDVSDTGSPKKLKYVDRQQMETLLDKKALEKRYRLKFVRVEFHAAHGIELDEDNRKFIVKPLLDSLVSLGLAKSDKEIKSDVHQRMDKDNPNI